MHAWKLVAAQGFIFIMTETYDPATAATVSSAATAAQHLIRNNAANVTTSKSLLSSSRDIVAFPFRAIYRADKFAFSTLPRYIIRAVGLEGLAAQLMEDSPGTAAMAAETVGNGAAEAGSNPETSSYVADFFITLKQLSGFFSYLTSRWSLACFTVVSVAGNNAIVLVPWDEQLERTGSNDYPRLLF